MANASPAGLPAEQPQNGESPLVQQAAQLLHKRFRVKLKDGRVLVGELHCLDREGNIILSNSYVQREEPAKLQDERRMGLVLIPPEHRVSCEVEVMPREADYMEELLTV